MAHYITADGTLHNIKMVGVALYLSNRDIIELDVTDLDELKNLWCRNNQLTHLDLSANKKLVQLACYGNPQLTNIIMRNDAVCDIFCDIQSLNIDALPKLVKDVILYIK